MTPTQVADFHAAYQHFAGFDSANQRGRESFLSSRSPEKRLPSRGESKGTGVVF